MVSSSVYVYAATITLASLVIAGACLLWLIRKEPGQRIFYRDLAIVFVLAFYIPGIIFFFKRDLSVWWLLIPVVFLALSFKGLLGALFWKAVPLTRIPLGAAAQNSDNVLKIVHLSDLHLCAADTTLEGGLARQNVVDACRKALTWAQGQSPDLIVITGDITDTGVRDEWELFESLTKELPEWQEKIVFIPGNHDLAIQQRHFGADNDGNALLDYDQRCLAFVRSYFSLMPSAAKVILLQGRLEHTEVELQQFLGYAQAPIDTYLEHPPRAQIAGEMMQSLAKDFAESLKDRDKNTAAWRRALSEYVPGIVFPEELRAIFQPENGFWPNEKYPLRLDLLQWLFPLIVYENDRVVVVALNSNTTASSWLADGALGHLGAHQLDRFKLLLKSRPKDKVVLVLIHHHIGCPPDIQHRIAKTMVELKALQLHEGPQLAQLLQEHGAPTVLMHGHKHVGYAAKAGAITVVSGASVPYGNRLGGANCNSLGIDAQGNVAAHASTTIGCS